MVDDSGALPLPRRVPGASGSPRPPIAVERAPIPEDLRQRVLAAIAVELERDKAEALRSAQEQGGVSERAGSGGSSGTRERAAFGVLRRAGKRAVSGEPGDLADRAASRGDKAASLGDKAASLGDKATAGDWAGLDEAPTAAGVAATDELAEAAEPAGSGGLAGTAEVAGYGGLAETGEVAGSGGAAETADVAGPGTTASAGVPSADVSDTSGDALQLETAEDGAGTSTRAVPGGSAWFTAVSDGAGDAGQAGAPGLADAATVDDDSWLTGGATRADDSGAGRHAGREARGAGRAEGTVWDVAPKPGALAGEPADTAARHQDASPGDAASLGYGIIGDPEDHETPPGPDSGTEDDGAGADTGKPPALDVFASDAPTRRDVTLPRRAPGANGAPQPPAHLRREYLPPSLLGRRLDPEAHTEPIPRIAGSHPGDPAGPPDPRPTSGWTFADIAPPASQPVRDVVAPPDGQAAPSGAGPAAAPALAGPADPAAPPSRAPQAALPVAPILGSPATASAPAGSTSAGSASTDSGPAGSAPDSGAAGSAPGAPVSADGPLYQAGPAVAGSPVPSPAATSWLEEPPGATATSGSFAASPPGTAPPATESSAMGPPAPDLAPYSWPAGRDTASADNGGPHLGTGQTHPGNGRAAGTTAPWPSAARPPARPAAPKARPRRPGGRPYRVAGLFLSVVALIAAGTVALLMSGRGGHQTGSGTAASGAAAVRDRAVAWVASQVSRAAVVACDPVTCQALRSHGVPASSLYPLGHGNASPLQAQVIVATAPVRDQFGSLLGSVYAPGVLASFGSGANRIDIRLTAPHGAAAYRAMLRSALLSRKAAGAELLRSGRITVTGVARRELAAGQVDGRLVLAIAQMAAAHPMFIVDFGVPAPGASAGLPLRQADIAEGVHAHRHLGRVANAGYVRSMVEFLQVQRGQFRPASVRSLRLPDGLAVLRIVFTAPSPLGLLGPHG